MWTVMAFVACVANGPCAHVVPIPTDLQVGYTTEEACLATSYDLVVAAQRKAGVSYTFSLVCGRST